MSSLLGYVAVGEPEARREKVSGLARILRVVFEYPRIIDLAMSNALAIVLKPLTWRWAVCLTNGREVARFYGPGARMRALRYLRAEFGLGAPLPSS